MCGIAGFFSAAPLGNQARPHLEAMVRAQTHRGPDGEGYHIEEERGIALGHARLSIIDLHTGNQPLFSFDKKLALVANGEFYDYKRIRAELMTLGARFTTRSDSEIALPLYQMQGLPFVENLRGEFAFALFDVEKEQLILVRDRFGIRPLFFHHNAESLHFASEVKCLAAHPDIPVRLDRRAALNQLMHTMVPGTSAFENIHALPPGHMLIASRRGERIEIETRCYWDLDFPQLDQRDPHAPAEPYIESIRENLVRSVALRLEADVPVGCYLSGGIDSCCILGMASGAQQSPVKAFTISFDNAEFDESKIAREMAHSVNADQDIIHLMAEDLYGSNYETTAWHAERTFYNTLGVAKWCMSRHVHQAGYKTVITGEGSDELFGGYPGFKRDMFLHGIKDEPDEVRRQYQQALEESNKLFKGSILTEQSEQHEAFEQLCGFTPSWIQPWIATLRVARPLLSDATAEELREYDPVAAIAQKIDSSMLEGRHPLDKAQYTWSKTMLEGQILNWGGDRVDMANSMESRPAFLDHHVAEAAVQVPPHYRIKGNTEKWVLREAVRGVLPEVLYKRQKFAFMAPPAHTDELKQQRLRSLTDRYLAPDLVVDCGILDPGRVLTFLENYRSDRDPVSLTRKDALLNHLVCLHILHSRFVCANPSLL